MDQDHPKRPRPKFEHTTTHFAKQYPDGDEMLAVSATQEAFGLASGRDRAPSSARQVRGEPRKKLRASATT
ncbi:MAG TPA: hypothetical protein VHC22_02135 [Pirellulales bacterium]|nr:hypothetical protein [Pirellulales bacterium]